MRIMYRRTGGTDIVLSADELATAIDAYLVARRVTVNGARTIDVTAYDEGAARVFVDPSGHVLDNRIKE